MQSVHPPVQLGPGRTCRERFFRQWLRTGGKSCGSIQDFDPEADFEIGSIESRPQVAEAIAKEASASGIAFFTVQRGAHELLQVGWLSLQK